MTIKIIADSAADIDVTSINGIAYANVPLKLQIDSHTWVDNDQLNLDAFLSALKATHEKAISSCPNTNDWLTAFAGADEIFVVTITSKLSGSYNSACQASAIYRESHPDARIHIFDSLSASSQMQLIILKIAELAKMKLKFTEIVNQAETYMQTTKLLFSLKELDNLANNGRIKPTIAKLAHLLKLYIIGTAKDGQFALLAKVRSAKRSQRALLTQMQAMGYTGKRVQINHVQAPNAAQQLKELILTSYPTAQVEIGTCRGLCSFYAENGGLMVGFEQ